MSDYYVHEEDGSSHFTLEDGSGDLLRETGDVERSASLEATAAISVYGSGPFSPSRVSQLVAEVIAQGAGNVRTSQDVAEVVVAPSAAEVRVSQSVVELIVQGAADARVSQLPVEVVMQNTEEAVSVFLLYWTVE